MLGGNVKLVPAISPDGQFWINLWPCCHQGIKTLTDHLAKDKSKGHKGKRDEEKKGVGILHQGQPVRVSRHLMQKKCSKQICNGEPLLWQ